MATIYKKFSFRAVMVAMLIMLNVIILFAASVYNKNLFWWLLLSALLLVLAVVDSQQKQHAIIRNFPAIPLVSLLFQECFLTLAICRHALALHPEIISAQSF